MGKLLQAGQEENAHRIHVEVGVFRIGGPDLVARFLDVEPCQEEKSEHYEVWLLNWEAADQLCSSVCLLPGVEGAFTLQVEAVQAVFHVTNAEDGLGLDYWIV